MNNFFNNLITNVKGVMKKMGLINDINNLTQFSAVQESEWDYERILVWRSLYRGWLDKYNGVPFHEVQYTTVDGQKRKRNRATLGMPKVASERMAQLVYNEKCIINISDQTLSDNIHEIMDDNSFNKQFQRFLEYGFAMGGFVIKPFVKDGKIKLTYVTAQNFFPLQSTNDDIQSGVFVSETRRGDKFYKLCEWHTWDGTDYVITNELYQSEDRETLGIKVPLALLYPNTEPEIRIKGLDKPLFVYIKPNIANNFETSSPLGISIFGNSLDTLKTLDIAFDSYQREFSLGKRRILVPNSAVRMQVDPVTGAMHRYFDAEDEVYQAIGGDMDSEMIKDMSTPLRVEDHIKAINSMLDLLAMQMGFSAGTFTFEGGGVKTATEVISVNSQTFRTKQAHETMIEQGIKDLIDSMVVLAQLYDIFPAPTGEYDVNVEFDDSITEDKEANANFYITLVASGMMPKVEAMMRIHDLTREQALEWLKQIALEQQEEVQALNPASPTAPTQSDPMNSVEEQKGIFKGLLANAENPVKNADYQSK
jgi:A118 family predicted phage portal protein